MNADNMVVDNVLTNISLKDVPLYKEAIKQYKEKYHENILYISDDAYDAYGNKLNYLKSLHVTRWKNMTNFWDIYDKLKDERKLNNERN